VQNINPLDTNMILLKLESNMPANTMPANVSLPKSNTVSPTTSFLVRFSFAIIPALFRKDNKFNYELKITG